MFININSVVTNSSIDTTCVHTQYTRIDSSILRCLSVAVHACYILEYTFFSCFLILGGFFLFTFCSSAVLFSNVRSYVDQSCSSWKSMTLIFVSC